MTEVTKNVLIIGGNSGIGEQVISRLSDSRHALYVAVRNPGELKSHPALSAQRFDVTDPTHVLDLPDSLDAVIYLPGTINLRPFHRLTPEDFSNDMAVNFFGAVRVIQQALPALKRSKSGSASIVLFSSVAATTGMPFHASISAAKAALEGMARSLAAELAPRIRVNTIAPSLTNTPLASPLLANEDRAAAAAKRHPLQRVGDPAEVAELVEFLMGSASGFITGQVFKVDGGMSSLRLF